MNSAEAVRQLEELEPVPSPGPGPTYDHIVGNQIRYTIKMIRHMRYTRRRRKLEELVAKQSGEMDVAGQP
jgi:hypothetical protein